VRFFFDNTFPPRFVQAIRVLAELQEVDLTHLADRFPRDTPDPVWTGALGVEGDWIIISSDANICRGKAEQAAWRESGLTAFFVDQLQWRTYTESHGRARPLAPFQLGSLADSHGKADRECLILAGAIGGSSAGAWPAGSGEIYCSK
jgi:PIN domain-containing protein